MSLACLRPFIAFGIVAFASSCTALLDTPADVQCSTTADCTARGPQFAFSVCTPDGVCAKPADFCETDQQCADANPGKLFVCGQERKCVPGCSTNEQCIGANGGKPFLCENKQCVEGCTTNQQCIDANAGKPFLCSEKKCVVGCTSNKQCNEAFGGSVTKPYYCRRPDAVPQCVPLLLPDADVCPQILLRSADDLNNDDIYWVGLVCSQAGATPSLGPGQIEGAYLALLEWMRSGGGGLTMGNKKRPVGFVNCDNNVNPTLALDHLTNDLKMKAIIGPSNSGVFGTNGPTQIAARNVVAISGAGGGAASDVLKNSNGFLWRTQPAAASYINAVPVYVTLFEQLVRAKLGLAAGDKVKVIVAASSENLGTTASTIMLNNTVINGQKAADQLINPAVSLTTGNYLNINYGNTTTDPTGSKALQIAAADTIVQVKPHFVYLVGRAESFTIMDLVEKAWTDPNYRPVWALETTQFNATASTWVNQFSDPNRPTDDVSVGLMRDDLRKRVIGPTATSSNPAQAKLYNSRHIAEFTSYVHAALPKAPKAVGPTLYSMGYYDAVYTMFGALTAAQKADPTGEDIRAGIAKTQPFTGLTPIDISPDTIGTISGTLAGGGRVDLNGILSDLNFVDNSVDTAVGFWCLPKTTTTPLTPAVPPVESGLAYNPVTKALTGVVPTGLTFVRCDP